MGRGLSSPALALADDQRTGELVGSKGLTCDEARRRSYASLPLRGRAAVCRALRETHELTGVPGFYVAEGEHGPYRSFAGSPGLLIPVRGPHGAIRGLRVRPDDVKKAGGKYMWFSSEKKPGGVASGAHCHVARPPGPATDPAIWITEGELKADIAAVLLGAVVLSVPGVSLWQRALADLIAMLPGGGRVVLAFDADWRKKRLVHAALWNLIVSCTAIGSRVEAALWEPTHKGIDDLLLAGLRPTLSEPTAVPPTPWELKVTARRVAATTAVLAREAVDLATMRTAIREAFEGLSPRR